jgi:hypothetical protein
MTGGKKQARSRQEAGKKQARSRQEASKKQARSKRQKRVSICMDS